MKNIKIIVATHKKYQMPEDQMYFPVQVGAEGKTKIEEYTQDNTGNNISLKNPYFCELTGLYWAWKNLEAENIGLVHYRRYFTNKKKIFMVKNEYFLFVGIFNQCTNEHEKILIIIIFQLFLDRLLLLFQHQLLVLYHLA